MKIVIIGGRGNGTVIQSTIEDCRRSGNNVELVGYLNDFETAVNGYPVLGKITPEAIETIDHSFRFIFAMSNVSMAREREVMLDSLNIPLARFATIVHPTAVVGQNSFIGAGSVLMPYSVVSPDVVIGNHSQMYAQSFVGHDSIIGDKVFVANNVSVGGRVQVADCAHLGSGALIRERIRVGSHALVGMGSVVLKDVPDGATVVGNPARILRLC